MPRTTTLQTLACQWLYAERIMRPGRTTLRELIGTAREAALQEVYTTICDCLSERQCKQLDALLKPSAPSEPSETELNIGVTPPRGSARSRLEPFKLLPRRESPVALITLTERLPEMQALDLATLPILHEIHPATRALLASWGYRHDVWSLRRFAAPKRYSMVL